MPTPTHTTGVRNCFRCGKEFYSNETERVCSQCRKPKPFQRESAGQPLTMRERQIVHLVREAKANKEIAYELRLAEGTIKEYLNRIFRKLGMKNRTELAIWSIRQDAAA